jgi:hypothetical protein
MRFSISRFSIPALLGMALMLLPSGATGAWAQGADITEPDLHVTGSFGFDYSNGGYGTAQNTNVLLGLFGVGLETGNFRFTAGMPYMRISGRGLVVFDAGGNVILVNRRNGPLDDRTGWGDLNLSASYTVPSSALDDFEVRLTATTKLPTASSRRRLSTGEADFGLSIDVSRQYGIWGPFLSAGYLIPGRPALYTLRDTASVSVGTSIELSEHLVAITSYDYDSESAPQAAASHQLFGSLSWIRDGGITLTGYAKLGLNSGSPDVGGGLLLSYSFR